MYYEYQVRVYVSACAPVRVSEGNEEVGAAGGRGGETGVWWRQVWRLAGQVNMADVEEVRHSSSLLYFHSHSLVYLPFHIPPFPSIPFPTPAFPPFGLSSLPFLHQPILSPSLPFLTVFFFFSLFFFPLSALHTLPFFIFLPFSSFFFVDFSLFFLCFNFSSHHIPSVSFPSFSVPFP